jgi:N-acetylglucosaminyl-diphospho-decaprenol L-rhamnosyltransferase
MNITISIVSHGHSYSIRHLLNDLNAYSGLYKIYVMLTWNAPELETLTEEIIQTSSKWPIKIIKNTQKKGFGKNHNLAFASALPGIWCVVNPDVRLPQANFQSLHVALSKTDVGLVFPSQLSPDGRPLDYQRGLVTPWSLLKRYLLKTKAQTAHVDWVSGCFMAFPSKVYQQSNGFDTKYFLYCEDVDICLRLQLAGYKMVEADFSIIHDTRRGTLKKWDHFKWHASSLLKLWCSRAFWAYLWNRHKIRQR